jgi:tRNA threonylcarbamoyl adenosine modification protein (Sua5/YciO/YrdC/YwlC family)
LISISDNNADYTAAQIIRKQGVCILPTDTVYAFACALSDKKAIEKMAQLKGVRLDNARFSIVCNDLSHLATFTKPISTPYYRALKRHTPGMFTFLLEASSLVPKLFTSRRTTIGLRVPDHDFLQRLLTQLGEPLVVSSVHCKENTGEYPLEAIDLEDDWSNDVAEIFFEDTSKMLLSTIVDFSGLNPVVVRQGAGEWNP